LRPAAGRRPCAPANRPSPATPPGNATTFIVQGGSTLQSFGDNYIAGNADGDPSPPVIARK